MLQGACGGQRTTLAVSPHLSLCLGEDLLVCPLSIPGWLACQHPESLLSLHHTGCRCAGIAQTVPGIDTGHGDSNPGPHTCTASTLPLGHLPSLRVSTPDVWLDRITSTRHKLESSEGREPQVRKCLYKIQLYSIFLISD